MGVQMMLCEYVLRRCIGIGWHTQSQRRNRRRMRVKDYTEGVGRRILVVVE